jgi:hypothetical protein
VFYHEAHDGLEDYEDPKRVFVTFAIFVSFVVETDLLV